MDHNTYLIIHTLSTVSDNTQQSQGFGQILHCLRFARTGGSSRGTAQFHTEGLGQCEVDTVSEWRDDESAIETHVLVTVTKLTSTLSDQ